MDPGVGALAIVWLVGAFAIVFGVLMIIAAFRLRSWRRGKDRTAAAAGAA
jgi:uncharacterized membrane protein HdeD (DUF308 family)